MKLEEQQGQTLVRLVEIMQRLLAPDGCPWDREQTLQTLRAYVIEEAFEVAEAIDHGSASELREELGDLLLQVVFQSELARREGWFGPDDVVEAICTKLIRRHPHVFAGLKVADSDEVVANWEKIKAEEKKERRTLDGVPKAMPALLQAVRMGEKAAHRGYDFKDAQGARQKIVEELEELDQALLGKHPDSVRHEIGDVLFAVSSLARKLGEDPEACLRESLSRFKKRFYTIEDHLHAQGRTLEELSETERDALWLELKAKADSA